MWVCPPTAVIIFGLRDPTIIGSRPDTKKLLFAATRFQFKESIRGASSADRFFMLQVNENNLRKNALKQSILLQECTNQWSTVATKQIIDSRQIKNEPDFLTCLLFGPRSPFWTASCPSELLFFEVFLLRSTNTLFVVASKFAYILREGANLTCFSVGIKSDMFFVRGIRNWRCAGRI